MLDQLSANEPTRLSVSETPRADHQRAKGRAMVSLRTNGKLGQLYQSGSAKVMLPRVHSPTPEVVFLNTSGGLTGGDHLSYELELAPHSQAIATTQTAERAYFSNSGTARADVRMQVGAHSRLDWLPQEMILFNGSDLTREITLELGDQAEALFLETIILGRHAMGEVVREARLRDLRRIYRQGRLFWADPLTITPQALADAAGAALLGPVRAFSTLVFASPSASDLLEPLRRVLDEPATQAAASAFDGKLILRILACNGLPLRRQILRALRVLRPGPLPRVWQI